MTLIELARILGSLAIIAAGIAVGHRLGGGMGAVAGWAIGSVVGHFVAPVYQLVWLLFTSGDDS
jgi:hypothetical protein